MKKSSKPVTGGILTLLSGALSLLPLGIAAIILVAISRDEFD